MPMVTGSRGKGLALFLFQALPGIWPRVSFSTAVTRERLLETNFILVLLNELFEKAKIKLES